MSKERKYKMGFVILHYMAINQTLECIKSIKKVIDKNKDEIIVVDNASPDRTGQFLAEKYKDCNIHIILSEDNLGFAKGNNLGYSMAKNQLGCDFIILLNNDTLILQKNFCELIELEYEQRRFGILGPKILDKDGSNTFSNPSTVKHSSLHSICIGQIANWIRYLLSFFGCDLIIDSLIKLIDDDKKKYAADIRVENIKLHGCCYIFSPEAVQIMEGLNPKTFMFLEEDILCLMAQRLGLEMVYQPNIQIVHLEDQSTLEYFHNKPIRVRRFQYKCQITSFKVLKEEVKNYEN